jgi:hypothetical protein
MSVRKGSALLVGVVVAAALVAGPAAAKQLPVTKIRFKVVDHEVTTGESILGDVAVFTRSGRKWVPLPGATLSLRVDGVEAGTLVTDADGRADVTYVTSLEGEHVMKVVFAGDDAHKRAQRAQGFSVAGAV